VLSDYHTCYLQIINNEEAERRGKVYDSQGLTYLFDLDFDGDDCVYTIDAQNYGNVSHFVNHSVGNLTLVLNHKLPWCFEVSLAI